MMLQVHSYERFYPVNDWQINECGQTSIVIGACLWQPSTRAHDDHEIVGPELFSHADPAQPQNPGYTAMICSSPGASGLTVSHQTCVAADCAQLAGDGGNSEGLTINYVDLPGNCQAVSNGAYYFQGNSSDQTTILPLQQLPSPELLLRPDPMSV